MARRGTGIDPQRLRRRAGEPAPEGLGLPPSDSAIVSIDRPGATEALAAAGIKAISRADRTRISCHVPANLEDVDRALTALT